MKRLVLAALFAVLFGGYAFAQDLKATPTPDTVQVDGFNLDLAKSYKWDDITKGMKFGSPEYKKARLMCIAWGKAVESAQMAAKAGDYAKAEMLAPTYLMRAFYGLNHLRQLMGGEQDKKGHWSNYDADPTSGIYTGDNEASIKIQYEAVRKSVGLALLSGEKVDSKGNSVETVDKYLDDYADGILADVLK